MATNIKKTVSEKQEGTPISFNTEDFVVIKLKGSDKEYVEHKHFANRLVEAKKAELVKGAEIERIIPKTTVLPS